MHGFIIVCDITNLQSIRDVPEWLKQIERNSDVTEGRQVTVLVNKMESLISLNSSAISGQMQFAAESEMSHSRIEIQEGALDRLNLVLQRDYPDVGLYEISIAENHQVFESIQDFSEALKTNHTAFIRQRYLKI